MKKSELIEALCTELDIPERKAQNCVDTFFECMADALADGGQIQIRGFGSFKVKEYQPYLGRNRQDWQTHPSWWEEASSL